MISVKVIAPWWSSISFVMLGQKLWVYANVLHKCIEHVTRVLGSLARSLNTTVNHII